MFIADGHLTTKTAAHVSQQLANVLQNSNSVEFFELEIDQTIPGDPRTIPRKFFVKATFEPSTALVLANHQHLWRCLTREGYPIDILFGHVADWEFEPCLVFVSDDAFDAAEGKQ